MIGLSTRNIIGPQWFTGIGVTLLLIHLGLMGGWTSPTLIKLMDTNSPVPLSTNQASWLASLLHLSRVFGCIMGTVSTHSFGSKRSIFITLFPIAFGWFIIILASSPEWLYVGRLCMGLSLGMIFGTFPLFIGEVAIPQIRGALISLATVGCPCGQLIATICGTYMSISAAASIYLILALPLMVLFFWLPESPHHLVKIGKCEDAKNSIEWYRSGDQVDQELESIQKLVADNNKSFVEKLHELITPPIRRSTIQIVILFTLTQFSGLNIIIFYIETILRRAKFTLFRPAELVIYVNLVSILAAAASIFMIDRCGRRFLLVVASTGITLSLIGLMCHFLFMNMDLVAIENLQWLPLTSMFLFMVSFFFGLFPAPNAILGEIFPSNIKCTAACIAILVAAIMSFISTKTYQPLLDLLGDAYVFMIYACITILLIPYSLFALHETKGKSLQQIQEELRNSQ